MAGLQAIIVWSSRQQTPPVAGALQNYRSPNHKKRNNLLRAPSQGKNITQVHTSNRSAHSPACLEASEYQEQRIQQKPSFITQSDTSETGGSTHFHVVLMSAQLAGDMQVVLGVFKRSVGHHSSIAESHLSLLEAANLVGSRDHLVDESPDALSVFPYFDVFTESERGHPILPALLFWINGHILSS
jgi:hypothetical protein